MRTRLDGGQRCCEAAPAIKVSAPDAPAPSLLLLCFVRCFFFPPPQALERSGACRAPALAPSTSCRLARESRSVRRAVGLGAHACAHVESPENAGQGRQEKANRSFF